MEEISWRSRGYLPHFDQPNLIQGITFHLWDSIPKHVLLSLANDPVYSDNPSKRKKIEEYLNAGHGRCYMSQTRIATLVENALLYFDTVRYNLFAWVVMPNHVHALVQRFEEQSLDDILHSWKSYSANEANRILGRCGKFWFREYYDRYIRNAKHFANAVDYIHYNPVAAELVYSPEEYPYSSARRFTDWRDTEPGRFYM